MSLFAEDDTTAWRTTIEGTFFRLRRSKKIKEKDSEAKTKTQEYREQATEFKDFQVEKITVSKLFNEKRVFPQGTQARTTFVRPLKSQGDLSALNFDQFIPGDLVKKRFEYNPGNDEWQKIKNYIDKLRLVYGDNKIRYFVYEKNTRKGSKLPEPVRICEILMPRNPGITLDKFLEQVEAGKIMLGMADKLLIIKNLCLALQKLHKANLVHRDIKPANIIIYPKSKEIAIIDLGSAAFTTEIIDLCADITPEYSAPELFKLEQTYKQKLLGKETLLGNPSPSTDIFALTLIIVSILCSPSITNDTNIFTKLGIDLAELQTKHYPQITAAVIEKARNIIRQEPLSTPLGNTLVNGLQEDPDNRPNINMILQAIDHELEAREKLESEAREKLEVKKIPASHNDGPNDNPKESQCSIV